MADARQRLLRLLRGGSWDDRPKNCRSAYRDHAQPGDASSDVGFRVVCRDPAGHTIPPLDETL